MSPELNPEVMAKAEALAEALAESKEYLAFKEAREELDRHEAAKIMLRDFQAKQAALQRKMMAGETPAESDVRRLEEAYRLVALNPYVRKVIEAELAFSELLAAVQEVLAKAVGIELPGDDEGEAGGSTLERASSLQGASPLQTGTAGNLGGTARRPDEGGSARSRLWVPGR